jgi:hypothetical protein
MGLTIEIKIRIGKSISIYFDIDLSEVSANRFDAWRQLSENMRLANFDARFENRIRAIKTVQR